MKNNFHILLSFLKDHAKTIILICLFSVINVLLGLLYRVPFERSMLWLLIVLFIGFLASIWEMFKYKHQYEILKQQTNKKRFPAELHLPKANSVIETEYQKMIVKLKNDLVSLEREKQLEINDTKEFIQLWVHEIKSPIAGLDLSFQNSHHPNIDDYQEYLQRIEKYVDNILNYYRINSHQTDYNFETVELDLLIKKSIKKYQKLFIEKNLSLHYHQINQRVLTDSKWLLFVLEQIISNAIKYTEKGSVSIYFEEPETLIIEDTGIGIEADELARIGQKHFTGRVGRQYRESTGFGLYFAFKILRKLNHEIEIVSEPKMGTKVKIIFRDAI